jgi:phosphoserine phosphatase
MSNVKLHLTAVLLAIVAACGDNGSDQPMPDAPEQPTPDAPPDQPPPDTCQPTALRTDLTWYGTNRQTLTTWLDSKGCDSAGYDDNVKPIALFDWDNTVVKNDVGDALTFYMIAQGKVRQPPNQNWKLTSPYMVDAAAAALTRDCGTTVAAGAVLPTNTVAGQACADQMLSMYVDNLVKGEATPTTAFIGHDFRRMEPTYAWTPQLLAGYTHEEIAQFSLNATGPMFAAAEGTTQTVGTRAGLNAYLHIYDQIKDLAAGAQSRGYDVWVITASPQDLVGALAPMIGVAANHVIGIRSQTDGNGKLLYTFEGCGPVADGSATMISYIEGKRCWVNKVIYGDTTATAINRRSAADRARQVFAAGDSDTDIEFLRDSQYKLVINRQKNELMCFAYRNEGDSWRVNPMFIGGRAMKTSLYPCSTTACKTSAGVGGACHDDANIVIPDQADTVYQQ